MPQDTTDPHAGALEQALRLLLQPLAQLAVARGVPFAQVESLLKQAFVQAADQAHPGSLAHRKVSRISTATGISRREVTRLTQAQAVSARPARSLPSEVFAHWMSSRRYRQRDGTPRELPRLGPAPSFETLAQEVTRDVHPRSLLDELLRLKMALHDPQRDVVSLQRDAFVPSGDSARMLGFLGENVGDHLSAAVQNIIGGDRRHFEQAIFAEGLSESSMQWVRQAIGTMWPEMLARLVPELEARIEADARTPAEAQRRLRIGLYTFEEQPRSDEPAARLPARKPAKGRSP